MKNSKLKKVKLYNIDFTKNYIDLIEYNKIDKKTIENFYNENKENLENFYKLIELDFLIENKINIKENKEKRKNLINENLKNKFFNIYNLENFIKFLDENKYNLINDKKYIDKVGKKLDSMDKSIYESIINYFILNCLDKDYFINQKFLNSKIKSIYSKKDLISLDEIKTFNFKNLKSDFIENFNNKYVLDYIKDFNKNNVDLLKDINDLLKDKDYNKENYKFKLQLIKENKNNIKDLKTFKNKYYIMYKNLENNINNKIKNRTLKIKDKFGFLMDDFIENNSKDLKKQVYKNKILLYKNNLYFKKYNYKDYINNKNIKYLNYINENLDLDLDKDKKYKSLKLIVDYKIKNK